METLPTIEEIEEVELTDLERIALSSINEIVRDAALSIEELTEIKEKVL